MEYLDIYDNNGNKTGKQIERGNKNLGENEYIKLSTLWLKSGDKYLLQVCSEEKGSEYAVTGGHVSAGNDAKFQAILEAEEELGLHIDSDRLSYLGRIIIRKAMFEVFMLEDDTLQNKTFTLQKEEVAEVLWLTKSEIESLPDDILRKSTKIQYETFIK